MLKVLIAHVVAPFDVELQFSDRSHGIWHAASYLAEHTGPLLDKLRDPTYFQCLVIDAGGLCWPNGLELSAARVHSLSKPLLVA